MAWDGDLKDCGADLIPSSSAMNLFDTEPTVLYYTFDPGKVQRFPTLKFPTTNLPRLPQVWKVWTFIFCDMGECALAF